MQTAQLRDSARAVASISARRGLKIRGQGEARPKGPKPESTGGRSSWEESRKPLPTSRVVNITVLVLLPIVSAILLANVN